MQPGSTLGPYEILEQLGAGGMGAVYRGRDTRLGREVALKVILPDSTPGSSYRSLLSEAKAASALNHPNVVTVYEASTIDGVDFIAMELIVGETLSARIVRGPMRMAEILGLAIQIGEGLTTAHQAGLVHRDLKPANVMITRDGRAKILDFGLARRMEMSPDSPTISLRTSAGAGVGTLAYMSPEQVRGEIPGPTTDIFSYGCVLYEMLCGERPFPGNSQIDQMYKICFEDPLPIAARRPDAPAPLAAIVAKALAKKPEDRFGSMASMVDALKVLVLATSSSVAVPVAAPAPAPRKIRRKPLLYSLGAVAVVALASFAAFRYFAHRGTSSTALSDQAVLRRVTYDSGLTGYSAISPNGKLIAYASDRNTGNLDIWTQPLEGGKPVRVTSDPADDYEPSFSPDGTMVVYRSDRQGGGVYMTPTSSTAEELLAPGGFDPKFSPDGKVVASWRGYVGGAFYPGAAGIVLVPLATRKAEVFRPDFESAAYPIWLSGSRLLFLGRKRDKKTGNSVVDWWVADIKGGEPVPTGAILRFRQAELRLPPAAYWYKPEALVTTTTGGEVYFSAQRGDATNIWKIPLDAGGHATAPPEGVTFGASFDASIGVASDDPQNTIVFSGLTLVNNIWKLDLRGSGASQPQRLFSDEPRLANPSVSADGRTLLVSTREANNSRLISVDLGTMSRNAVADVTGTQTEQFPVLSGDGKHVVFLRGDTAFLTTVADGPVYKLMPNCGRPTHTNFDASQVLCDSLSADERLLLWSHGTVTTLVQQPDGRNAPQSAGHFSPDGHWVVFTEGRPSSPEHRIVAVPNAPGRKLKAEEWIAISDGSDSDRSPVWGADGKHIYYISDVDGFTCIRARPVDPATARPTGPSIEIAHFHLASQTLRMLRASELSLSASSNFLVFTLGELKGNVWMKQVPREAK